MRRRFCLRKALVAVAVCVAAVLLVGCSPGPFDYQVENTTDEPVRVTFNGFALYQSDPRGEPFGGTLLQPGERATDSVYPRNFTHRVEENYGLLLARNAEGETVFSALLVLLARRDEGCVVRLGDPLVGVRADCRHDEPYSEEVQRQLTWAGRALWWRDAQPLVLLGLAAVLGSIALPLLRPTGGVMGRGSPRRHTPAWAQIVAVCAGALGTYLFLAPAYLTLYASAGVVRGPLTLLAFSGALAVLGVIPPLRQVVSSSLLVLGVAQFVLAGVNAVTEGLWSEAGGHAFAETLILFWLIAALPGVLAFLAGAFLRGVQPPELRRARRADRKVIFVKAPTS